MFSTTATPGAAALLNHEQQLRIARRSHELRHALLADTVDDTPRARRSRVRDRGAFFARGLRLAH